MIKYCAKLKSFIFALIAINLLPVQLIARQPQTKKQLIVLPDDGRVPFIKAIKATQKTLKICAYTLSDSKTIKAIQDAAERGVQVDLIVEPQRQEHDRSDNVQSVNQDSLKHPNIRFHFHNDQRQLHQKFFITDGKNAYIQTNNFDAESYDGTIKKPKDPPTRDFAFHVTDPKLIQQLNNRFDDIVEHKVHSEISNCNNDRQDYLVFGPGSQRADFLNLIQQAKESIDTYQQNFYDDEIVDAFKAALSKGVKIRIVMMKNPHGKNDLNVTHQQELKNAGAKIRFMTKYYQHTKVIIVDGKNSATQQMYLGSCNLFPKSLDEHYEAGIVSFDPKVIKHTRQVFDKDFSEAEPANFLTEKK